jgi:hyperosmotically inducible protein
LDELRSKARIMKTIISLTLMSSLLLAIPAGLGACVTTRTAGEQVDDATLKARVGRRLSADPDVRRMQIDVDVLDRVVTLRGDVDDPHMAKEAVRIAQNTKGVERVVDEIQIVSKEASKNDGDAGIKTKIGTELMADPNVKRMQVDVDVVNGVVYLSGVVADEDAKQAAERIAQHVDGVVRVENELKVSSDPMVKDKPPAEQHEGH